MDKLKMHTKNLADENFAKLSALFPNAVTETMDENGEVVRAIDKDILMQEINTKVVDGREERYQFTWPDKKRAMLSANAPISKTLRPCREESVDFDNTENLYIEGDNLDVLKTLQETYLHKVDIIYIDPPYNTGNNLIYHNNFYDTEEDYLKNSGQFDENLMLTQNLETDGRFHTNWLNMIYPRLMLSKNLLKDTGVLICAIDQSEVNTLGCVLKYLFSNMEVALISIIHNPSGTQGDNLSFNNEFAYVVYDGLNKNALAKEKRDEKDYDIRAFMNGAKGNTDSYLRQSGNNSFYPIYIKGEKIIGFGDPLPKNEHPNGANVLNDDGTISIYPIDDDGVERKWLFERNTVETIIDDLSVKYNNNRNIYEIIRIKKEFNFKSCWTDKKYSSKENGTLLLKKLLGTACFSFPKSLYNVMDCLKMVNHNKDNAIILDFFSGSSTTAHAVMQMNADDNGHRKFIMVQLPENLDANLKKATSAKEKQLIKDAIKYCDNNNYQHIITEIAKDRIRKAAEKIAEENRNAKFDGGFRVLKCESSNMKDVYYAPDEYRQDQLDLFESNIKEDRTPEDLLFQVMLDLGILLSSKIVEENISGKRVFTVAPELSNHLVACFDEDISDDVIRAIADKHPTYAVLRDNGMADSAVKTNFDQIFASVSPDTVRKVL